VVVPRRRNGALSERGATARTLWLGLFVLLLLLGWCLFFFFFWCLCARAPLLFVCFIFVNVMNLNVFDLHILLLALSSFLSSFTSIFEDSAVCKQPCLP
jgi:small-conductance mechanosensitive channel